jgi:type VI secretion system lysozyme-like protein
MSSPQLFYRLGVRANVIQLRDSISHDIVNLLNCAMRGASLGVSNDAPVASSVLNFGNPCMATSGRSRVDPQQIATSIRQTISAFEPRLLASRTTVSARQETDSPGCSKLYFDVHGLLKSQKSTITIRLTLDYQGGFFDCVQERR